MAITKLRNAAIHLDLEKRLADAAILEDRLRRTIVGQDDALQDLVDLYQVSARD